MKAWIAAYRRYITSTRNAHPRLEKRLTRLQDQRYLRFIGFRDEVHGFACMLGEPSLEWLYL